MNLNTPTFKQFLVHRFYNLFTKNKWFTEEHQAEEVAEAASVEEEEPQEEEAASVIAVAALVVVEHHVAAASVVVEHHVVAVEAVAVAPEAEEAEVALVPEPRSLFSPTRDSRVSTSSEAKMMLLSLRTSLQENPSIMKRESALR